MTLTHILLAVLALYMLQLFLQETSRFGFDLKGIVGNRDHLPDASLIAARLERAKDNLREALPFFIALTLAAMVRHGDNSPAASGALVFLLGRIAYVPAYLSGLPWLRSIAWLVAVGGLLQMALTLL